MFTWDYRDHRYTVKLSFMFYSLKTKLNKNWWIYECESESTSHSVVSNSLYPHIVHGILQARILEWVAFPFSRGFSQPRDRTQVSCIAGRFFAKLSHKGSPRSGVGSLSFLQRIFPTQESNWSLLHCRGILYQAEPQGKPKDIGVGSLFFLQWIFPTQESNWSLLHCRGILYQLRYQKYWKCFRRVSSYSNPKQICLLIHVNKSIIKL